MTVPFVKTNELDGALGIVPATSGLPMAVVGCSSTGTVNTPTTLARAADVIATFTSGPLVEDACYAIANYGRPVVCVRGTTTTPGAIGTKDITGFTGTSVITTTGTTDGDYEIYVKFPVGGTIATDGIKYRFSLDNGRTLSATFALGTANVLIVPGSGGVQINFGAGTVVAGDVIKVPTTGPRLGATDLNTALTALSSTTQPWEFVLLSDPMSSTLDGTVATWISGMIAAGKHHWAISSFRIPNTGEAEAAYLTAFGTAFNAFSNTSMVVCAGAAKTISGVSSYSFRAPVARSVGAFLSAVSEEQDIAALNLGPLPGVSIRDANGNPDEHDETLNPGLDDARATVLRTWENFQGVYVNNPKMISPTGSDFVWIQFRRVMNVARIALNAFMARRLSVPLRVNSKTGFVLEQELRAIETEANAMLASLLLSKPKASSAVLVLSRTDNILQTPFQLTGTLRITPLGYPKQIVIDVGFVNPAIRSGV